MDYDPNHEYHVDTEVSTLHSAIRIGKTENRHNAIQSIFAHMGKDFSHSGWDYVRHLWRQCPHLPLSCFDVWTIAVKDPQMLAALVLQMDEAFTEKLNVELPVFWELIPINCWASVVQSFKAYLQKNKADEADVQYILENRIQRIRKMNKSLEIIAKILEHRFLGQSLIQISFSIVEHLILNKEKGELQELIRRQANSDWPVAYQSELIAYWKQIDDAKKLGITLANLSEHQQAVVVLPALLARFCADKGIPENWIGNSSVIFKLKCLKSFDKHWFNQAYFYALAYFSPQS